MADLTCGKCSKILPVDRFATTGEGACPQCQKQQRIRVFNALHTGLAEQASVSASVFEGDSPCYYDADKRAVAVCDDCGRFISEFHRVILSPEHTTCLACLSSGREGQSKALTETSRVRYDNLALYLAVIPPVTLIGIYFTFITAPAALYVTLRYWKKGPNSLVPVTRWRFVVAAILALLQIAAIVLIILYISGVIED